MSNNYTAKQVSRMVVNPYATGDIMNQYEWLRDLVPEETYGVNLDKFFRFLAFVYDPNSPMAKDFTDIGQRKREAAREVVFNLEHEKEFRHISIAYLKFIKSSIWAEISVNDNLFWNYAEMLSRPVDDLLKAAKQQGEMTELMGKFRTRSAELRKEFFGGDEDLVKADAEDYRPESMNRKMRTNKV